MSRLLLSGLLAGALACLSGCTPSAYSFWHYSYAESPDADPTMLVNVFITYRGDYSALSEKQIRVYGFAPEDAENPLIDDRFFLEAGPAKATATWLSPDNIQIVVTDAEQALQWTVHYTRTTPTAHFNRSQVRESPLETEAIADNVI